MQTLSSEMEGAAAAGPAAPGEVVQQDSPRLPVHALHPQLLPAGVQQQHLLLDLELLLGRQVPLGHQLVPGLQDTAHAALVRRQYHHKSLEIEQSAMSL